MENKENKIEEYNENEELAKIIEKENIDIKENETITEEVNDTKDESVEVQNTQTEVPNEQEQNENEQPKTEYKKPEPPRIGIASDHRGVKMKQKLTIYLNKIGYTVLDYGTTGTSSVDYPEYGIKLGKAIRDEVIKQGIVICGSGIGISIACNKVKKVRCAKVNNIKEVKWARNDNDANVIALSARMPMFRAKDIVDTFLKTPFSGIERHQKRIDMLDNYEED